MLPRGSRGRDVPARAVAATESLVRGLAPGAGDRAPNRRGAGLRAVGRRARGRGPCSRGRPGQGPWGQGVGAPSLLPASIVRRLGACVGDAIVPSVRWLVPDGRVALGHPEWPEIDDRIRRAPTGEEPLDRRASGDAPYTSVVSKARDAPPRRRWCARSPG